MNRFSDAVNYYVSSFFYPLSLALIALLGWLTGAVWFTATLASILCFAPLFGDDGRGYLAAPLCVVPMVAGQFLFTAMEGYMYMFVAAYLVSLCAFVIIRRPHFHPGVLFGPYLVLFTVFLVSVVVDVVLSGTLESDALFFVVIMILIVCESGLTRSVLEENRDSFRYFSWCAIAMSLLISAEVFAFYLADYRTIFTPTFSLGWATSKEMVSTLLVCSLPFFGILIYRGKPWYALLMALPVITNILLATESGLLAMVLVFIPLVILSLRAYGRAYPYLCLGICAAFLATFAVSLGFSPAFRDIFVRAVHSLDFVNSPNYPVYRFALDGLLARPVVGLSAQKLVGVFTAMPGQLFLLKNTVLATGFMGGALGLAAYAIAEIVAYYACISRHSPDRWLLLVFLVTADFIGLTYNTVYNLFFLSFYLAAMAAYQSSNTYSRVVVKEDYYSSGMSEPQAGW